MAPASSRSSSASSRFAPPFGAYLLAWYVFPASLFAVFMAFGYTAENASAWTICQGIVLAAPLNYTFGLLVFGTIGPQGEELGWRGYLLPRWRVRFGETTSPLLVGIVWTFWHLPMFFDPAWVTKDVPFIENLATYAAGIVAISYAMAYASWISRENLIVSILMHAAINLSYAMLTSYEGPLHDNGRMQNVVLLIAAVLAALVLGFLWRLVKARRARAVG